MKASEFIARIQELIEVVGDVEMIVEGESTYGGWDFFAIACVETQNVIKHPTYPNLWIESGSDCSNSAGNDVLTLIKVW